MTPDQITQLRTKLTKVRTMMVAGDPCGYSHHQIYEWINEALALLPCPTCNGTKKVSKRDYIGACGLSDCSGVVYKKDMISKPFWPFRDHYTFKCPVCSKIFGQQKLIVWPQVPCPDCK